MSTVLEKKHRCGLNIQIIFSCQINVWLISLNILKIMVMKLFQWRKVKEILSYPCAYDGIGMSDLKKPALYQLVSYLYFEQ